MEFTNKEKEQITGRLRAYVAKFASQNKAVASMKGTRGMNGSRRSTAARHSAEAAHSAPDGRFLRALTI